jgi:hypothetical protein
LRIVGGYEFYPSTCTRPAMSARLSPIHARILAKQPHATATLRFPRCAGLQSLRAVMMERSCRSHRPRYPHPGQRPRHHYSHNCPDEISKATMATITNKSSRASLQLTHELGGYIWWMRSRAPTENLKNTPNSKICQLSLSATP